MNVGITPPRLRVWLINPYGPLPSEGWRDYSFITFGKTLAAAGHDVVWWTSGFSHHFKRHRSRDWIDEQIEPNFVVRLVPSPGYRRNIGLGRFWRDAVFASRTFMRAKKLAAPDIILYAENPLTMGFAGYALARHHGCPVVYDQMDLWPELMVNAAPKPLRRVVNALFSPVYARRRKIFRSLDGAIALAEPYLQSILRECDPGKEPPNTIIYNGIDVIAFRQAMQLPLPDYLASKMPGDGITAVFAGSLGPSYDILNLISVARRLHAESSSLQILIAGDGPLRPDVEGAARDLPNLTYLGVLPPTQLPAVYAAADIGLSCYTAKSNVEMPDKFYDYSAAGLAIVNSLVGEVAGHIERSGAGIQYVAGDADSLYAALSKLAGDREQLAGAKAASYRSGDIFDSVVQHEALPDFLESLVEGRSTKTVKRTACPKTDTYEESDHSA
jgi:glycosyltransferase involved in cell wall biosynthesis